MAQILKFRGEAAIQTAMDETRLKQIFKEAIVELLEEKQGILHDLVVEAIEDIALSRAIQEGIDSGDASKEEVLDILEGPGESLPHPGRGLSPGPPH